MEDRRNINISPAEWEIMRTVWANGTVTSRIIIDILQDKMGWSESTIKTLIGRLVDKGALVISREKKPYLYKASLSEDETIKESSQALLDQICQTKHNLALYHLAGQAHLSQANIEDLISLLTDKKKRAPEEVSCNCRPGQCYCQPCLSCHMQKENFLT